MRQSESLTKFAPAFLKAQKALKKAQKDGTNPHFHSKFPTFESVWDACMPSFHENDLMVVQRPEGSANGVTVHTMVLHVSGEFMEDALNMPCAKPNDPQAVGSALTYGRRYGLEAMAGIVREDDDAEAATNHTEVRATKPQPPPAATRTAPHDARTGEVAAVFPGYGKSAGMPVKGASFNDLQFYANGAKRSLADASKARFHAKEQALLDAINAELNASTKTEQGEVQF